MTTSVTIVASCDPEKTNVAVTVSDSEGGDVHESFILEDGQTAERSVYDSRVITVKEVSK